MIDLSLHPTPSNPAPGRFRVEAVESARGVFLRAARFMPQGFARGTVVIAQGRAESIEKYFELIGHFLRHDLMVVAFDFRGQGGSTRLLKNARKGHIEAIEDYDADLDAVMRQVVLADTPQPLTLIGHSTGALVALRAQARAPMRYARVILSSPLLELATGHKVACRLAAFLSFFGCARAFVPLGGETRMGTQPFALNTVTRDETRYQRFNEVVEIHPELAIGSPTIGWVRQVCRAMSALGEPHGLDALDRPMLILRAGADRVVSARAIEKMSRRLSRATCIDFPGAEHELFQERDRIRDQVLAAIDAYIGLQPRVPESADKAA